MSRPVPQLIKYAHMTEPDIFSRGLPSRLPEAYKKFFKEWTTGPKTPVHYRPEPGKWKRDPVTGVVTPVQNVPIPLRYPKEIHSGIWGGEAAILGYKTHGKYKQDSTKWFLPHLQRSAVYSEILDKRLSVIVTRRTIDLIIDHNGFDKYILETSSSDLYSLLALKLKKKMLLALFDKTLYPEDPVKQEKIYNKYKHHLDNYNREDLEWFGLSIGEAVQKLEAIEDSIKPKPLKHQFRAELVEELKTLAASEQLENVLRAEERKSASSWINKINPFAKNS